ncbi:hypothetical protein SBA4_1780005 [Candidatus Sulfopaludibacter sp. SbA4]|nr:hypothetical protein SBA4_1780005 [Candidatus Sulfopaludibacter sp. SbA4]
MVERQDDDLVCARRRALRRREPTVPGDIRRHVLRLRNLDRARMIMRSRCSLALALFAASAWAQLPDGPGKAETEKICAQCHELERSISLRQDRDGWQATMNKMITLGAKGTDQTRSSRPWWTTWPRITRAMRCLASMSIRRGPLSSKAD